MPKVDRVIEGAGSIERIPDELARRGLSRALLVTGRSLAGSDPVRKLVESLGDRLAGTFGEVQAHNPIDSLAGLVNRATAADADVIIGIGGGSAIDAAKLTSLGVGERIAGPREFLGYSISHGLTPLHGLPLPVIAVPTTLSAAEWNGVAAFVDEKTSTKELARYLGLTPKVVVLDPELCALTPRGLWVTTGVRALDHAVETAYATNAHPFTTALATAALRLLAQNLPLTAADAGDLTAALLCQQGAWMSLVGVHNVPVGLSHAIGHQLGAIGVPHGVTSCITLPHVMRFFEPQTRDQQRVMAQEMAQARGGVDTRSAADEIEALFAQLKVPRTIGEFGIAHNRLNDVVRATMGEAEAVIRQAPRPVSPDDVRELLEKAY